MSGWYRMHRGWQDNPMFAREEYSKRDAWVWMIERAAWKQTRAKAGGSIVTLERGQFTASIRFMAEAWGWHRAKVERFLNALKTETMIETRTETGQIVITVCNYDEYQASDDDAETPAETGVETPARHERDTSETNNKKDKNLRREEDSLLVDADEKPAANGKRYAFAGVTIRLNDADLARWTETYHAIPDIRAELAAIDAWFQGPDVTDAKRKGWFNAVPGMLSRKHNEALERKASGQPSFGFARRGEPEVDFAKIAGPYARRGVNH